MDEVRPAQSMGNIFGNYQLPSKRKGQPNSRRADLLQRISDSTGIPFRMLLRETFHLKDEWGNGILQMILDDSLRFSAETDWRARKAAQLIRASKPKREYGKVA